MWPEGWLGETGRALTMGKTLDLLLSEMRDHSDGCVEKRAQGEGPKRGGCDSGRRRWALYQGDGYGEKWLNPECVLKVGPAGCG